MRIVPWNRACLVQLRLGTTRSPSTSTYPGVLEHCDDVGRNSRVCYSRTGPIGPDRLALAFVRSAGAAPGSAVVWALGVMMTGITDHDDRLIRAAERIADALEQLVALSTSAGPKPRLVVARSRTDGSRSQPVRLKADGMLLARVQNLGEADTMLSRPTVQLGAITMQGGIVDAESVPQPSANVPASKDGAGVLLQFMLDRSAQNLFHDERMVILLPHSPGRFPGVTVLEVQLEPTGVAAGTPSWRPTGVRELPQDHGPT